MPFIKRCSSPFIGDSIVQWNLLILIRTLSGPAVLSFVERLSSFRGDFSIECVYASTFGLSFICEVLSSFGVSLIGVYTVISESALYVFACEL